MLLASDFRAMARDALRGNWVSATLIGLLSGLLGANIFGDSSINIESRYTERINVFFHSDTWYHYEIFFVIGGAVLVVYLLVMLVIGGVATLGYAKYNLNLVDHQEARVDDLFSQFHRLGQGFCMQFFRWLFIFLWSLLFVIPGVIASYRYAMTPYILLENPEMTAREAITASKELMKGNKFRLFCLSFSFIGWGLLAALPAVIGTAFVGASPFASGWLWLLSVPFFLLSLAAVQVVAAYAEAAIAAFYREICREKTPAAEPVQMESSPFETYQMPYEQVD